MRVSLVLTAGLLLAFTARRNAALRHAILVAGLAAAFIVPAAMLTMQVLPVSRWQLGLLGRVGLDDFAAVAVVEFATTKRTATTAPRALTTRPSRSFATRRDEARLGSWAQCVSAVGRIVPRASRTEPVEFALWAIDGQRPALDVAVRGDRQGDRARVLVGASATDRVAARPVTGDPFCPYSG